MICECDDNADDNDDYDDDDDRADHRNDLHRLLKPFYRT